MKEHNISLDFGKKCFTFDVKRTTKVKCTKTVVIEPNTECVVQGVLDTRVGVGMQGLLCWTL